MTTLPLRTLTLTSLALATVACVEPPTRSRPTPDAALTDDGSDMAPEPEEMGQAPPSQSGSLARHGHGGDPP